RWPRDWSSDVCSSDLPWGEKTVNFQPPFARAKYGDLFREHVGCDMRDFDAVKAKAKEFKVFTTLKDAATGSLIEKERDVLVNDRSEERRVGKGCRYW